MRNLRELDLVYVVNLEYHVPRLYRLTDNGKKILKFLNQYEEIEIKLTFEDFDLKLAKPTTNSTIVYVRKDGLGKTVNLIPVPDYVTEEIIEREKHDDGNYN